MDENAINEGVEYLPNGYGKPSFIGDEERKLKLHQI